MVLAYYSQRGLHENPNPKLRKYDPHLLHMKEFRYRLRGLG